MKESNSAIKWHCIKAVLAWLWYCKMTIFPNFDTVKKSELAKTMKLQNSQFKPNVDTVKNDSLTKSYT